jgi:hypothetical protein
MSSSLLIAERADPIQVLAGIVLADKSDRACLRAARLLLDYGWGKPRAPRELRSQEGKGHGQVVVYIVGPRRRPQVIVQGGNYNDRHGRVYRPVSPDRSPAWIRPPSPLRGCGVSRADNDHHKTTPNDR